MNDLTKIGLMDNCIDGDREKFDRLCGSMYDQFSCFFSLLQENGISRMPGKVSFNSNAEVAEFNLTPNVQLDSKEETVGVFGCKISITPSKQTTKIGIQAKK